MVFARLPVRSLKPFPPGLDVKVLILVATVGWAGLFEGLTLGAQKDNVCKFWSRQSFRGGLHIP
jgi:hypothetical protein